MTELPRGWATARLADICHIEMGQSPPSSTYNTDGAGLPFLQGKAEFGELYPTLGKYCSSPSKVAPTGAVLLSVRAPVGPTNIAPENCCIGRGLAAISPLGDISARYVLWALRDHEPALAKRGTGSTFTAVTKAQVASTPINMPPLNEQRRIVEKIEALFDEINRGVECLRDAKRALGLYRQSLLKSAFEGRLTADWRATNPHKLESPGTLLAHVREDREKCYATALCAWESEFSAWKEGERKSRKPAKPKRPTDLAVGTTVPDGNGVPSHWLWLSLSNLGDVTGGLTKNQQRNALPLKAKYLRVANVYSNRLKLDEIKEIGATEDELRKTRLVAGDLLFVEGNGSIEQIGRVAIWDGSVADIAYQNHLIRFRADGLLLPRFALYFMMSPIGRRRITAQASSTSGLHTLSISKVEGLPVPLCSPAEQSEIVRVLDANLDKADVLEREIDANLTRAEALRQSILKQAFSGKLVPQNPDDEPAQALLARIRANRDEDSTSLKQGVRPRPYVTTPRAMGLRPGYDFDNIQELIAQIEDEDSP